VCDDLDLLSSTFMSYCNYYIVNGSILETSVCYNLHESYIVLTEVLSLVYFAVQDSFNFLMSVTIQMQAITHTEQ